MAADITGVGWEHVSAAIALLTAEAGDLSLSQAEILGGLDPERVLTATVLLAGAFLRLALPGDDLSASALQYVGQAAAAYGAQIPPGGER